MRRFINSYPSERETIAMFERFVCFNAKRPSEQIAVLALDSEHAAVEGANYLALPRHRVAVIRAPGHLDSRGLA